MNEKNDSPLSVPLFIIALVFVFASAYMAGRDDGKKSVRKEALHKNHAYYAADENGDPVFTWK